MSDADAAMVTRALDATDVTKIGVGVIVALVVIGFLLSIVITMIVGRIVVVVVVIALAAVVWTQRQSVENKIDDKACNLTFFGVHLDPPDSFKAKCR